MIDRVKKIVRKKDQKQTKFFRKFFKKPKSLKKDQLSNTALVLINVITIQDHGNFYQNVCSCNTTPYKSQGGWGPTWDWDFCNKDECESEKISIIAKEAVDRDLYLDPHSFSPV